MDSLREIVSGFPYFRITIAFFLNGFTFLVLTGPLLSGSSLTRVLEWKTLLGPQDETATTHTVLALSALIIGFLINLVSIAITQVVRLLSDVVLNREFSPSWIKRVVARLVGQEALIEFKFFTSTELMNPAVARSLSNNAVIRSQLEWELFNYFLYWGLESNLMIFVAISWWKGEIDYGILPFILSLLPLGMYCSLRSLATGNLVRDTQQEPANVAGIVAK